MEDGSEKIHCTANQSYREAGGEKNKAIKKEVFRK